MAAGLNPFTPGQGCTVTAGVAAASLTIPAAYASRPCQVQIQVATNAAAFSFVGTAAAPDGTPSNLKIGVATGTVVWTVPQNATALSYIRIGAADATVYIIFGDGI